MPFGAAFRTAIESLPRGLRTRFAPAPTGHLHLGHVANAMAVWGAAAATGGTVVLRVEDHDRQRCRPAFEVAILDDLEALGFEPDEPSIASLRIRAPSPWRQSDNHAAYAAAVAALEALGRVYACDCSRATFSDWAAEHGERWSGPGCPGACAARRIPPATAGVAWRAALGDGDEAWTDLVLGSRTGSPAAGGDLPIRDRHGNWTYALCVVVDDMRHDIDLVVRGEDLLDATPVQVRLGRLLGRGQPPRFLHHPLILRPDGRKLSKADGATSVRELLRGGAGPADLRRRAAAAIGLA
ncbi:MAG TPA: glutamate--tRNA ligase family protein [Candidatus Limnocylindrales bacterium]|nr:glutamate--tRNA ligase family protein [Candidatus Limnocylindrales bacterium]